MSIAARLEPLVPDLVVASVARLLYPRFEPELTWLQSLCPPHGTAVDIGAWYGPWTTRLARRAGTVVAIEPMPHLSELLARTMPANVRVVPAAASDHVGTERIWTSADGRGARGVSSLVRRDVHSRSAAVRLVTVDGLGLIDVTLIKIDVDGHETAALHGARATIRRDRPALLIEAEYRIQPVEGITTLLAEWGYRPWVLPGRQWVPLDTVDLARHQRDTAGAAERGLLARALWPHPRYMNLLLCLPRQSRPPVRGLSRNRCFRSGPPGEDPAGWAL